MAAPVLVDEPRDRAVLADARLAVAAHPSREGLLVGTEVRAAAGAADITANAPTTSRRRDRRPRSPHRVASMPQGCLADRWPPCAIGRLGAQVVAQVVDDRRGGA